ncbi:uncharacterized protein [Heterodontus francisci]|uniref:uncharacterized protein isoform X3 n=1 Tax=Heterodontus francisci TaxID=7792 RepID=UPI00355C571D
MAVPNPREMKLQDSAEWNSLDSGFVSADLGQKWSEFYRHLSELLTEALRQVYGPQGDKGPFLQQLEVRTEGKCLMTREWLGILETLNQSESDLVVEMAKTLIQVNNEYYSCIGHGQFQEIYKHLLQRDQEIGNLLACSMEAAGTLDLMKVDFDLFASLISAHPQFAVSLKDVTSQHSQQERREFFQKMRRMLGQECLDEISDQERQGSAWCAREFLHALLLSLKTPQDQLNTFSMFHGDKILLPINIDSRWSKIFNKVMLLVHKHTFFKETEVMVWFGPTTADTFLKTCSSVGYPHISCELSRNKPGGNIVRFTQQLGKQQQRDAVSNMDIIQDAAGNRDHIFQEERRKEPGEQNRYQHVATMVYGGLRLIYDQCNEAPTIKGINVNEFESFLSQVSLVGPPFNVQAPSANTQLLLILPKYPSCSGLDINPTEVKHNLALFLAEKYPGQKTHLKTLIFRKLQQLFSEEEQKLLHTYLLLEEVGAIVDLTVSKGKRHLHLLWDVMQEFGALIRAWPVRYQNLLQTKEIRVAQIRDENLELFVPLADTGSHVWVLLHSHSPIAVVEKLWNYFTDCEAYCLLYKPVGRLYIKNKIKMFAYLIPNCDALVQALNKQHDSYKQVFKTKLLVHKNTSYRLQFGNTNVANIISVIPEGATAFIHSLCLNVPKTKYVLQIDGHFDDWPLVFQLIQEDKSCVVLNELITEEQLQQENEEYIFVKVDGKQYCILRIHNHITYQQFTAEMELTFPAETFNVYYKRKGDLPLLINGQNSIEYLLKHCRMGDIVLEAEEQSPCPRPEGTSEEEDPTLNELKGRLSSQSGSFKSSRIPRPQGRTQQSVGTPKHFLQKNKTELINRLTEIHSIIEELKNKDILNEIEYEKLLTAKYLSDQNRETLNCVIKKGSVAMNYFHDLLHRYHPLLIKDIESKESSVE